MSRDDKVLLFTLRLLREFPDWRYEEAHMAASRIVDAAEQMAFEMDVERDLESLPVVAA